MAVERHKYSMQANIRYDGRLVDVLDRIRAIRLVIMVHIEKDLGPDRELITLKIMTPYPARKTFLAIRKMCLGKIETLKDMLVRVFKIVSSNFNNPVVTLNQNCDVPIGEINKYFVSSEYLKDYSSLDFDFGKELVAIGYKYAQRTKLKLC